MFGAADVHNVLYLVWCISVDYVKSFFLMCSFSATFCWFQSENYYTIYLYQLFMMFELLL